MVKKNSKETISAPRFEPGTSQTQNRNIHSSSITVRPYRCQTVPMYQWQHILLLKLLFNAIILPLFFCSSEGFHHHSHGIYSSLTQTCKDTWFTALS